MHGCRHPAHADGLLVPLEGCDTVELDAGDVLVVRTPGGGYGPARTRPLAPDAHAGPVA
ncbi:hypothetical protein N7925_31215 [Streptomyces sp. CA-278952]|uniref:hypothetical protein n=1 Tax=Streptomyces sp. CA-278952 TaxID=2980556 RepID=UPI0023688638|nr:hypothetical protein [Streptomyces sp. CA-278952]WDG33778.1 hypothetical protein N7925_31215 [Streptomyces sp. CA-278952]